MILLAPAYGPLFGRQALSLTAKVLVVAATSDAELIGDQVDGLIKLLGQNANSSTVAGGHYVFLRPCTMAEATEMPLLCIDANGVDRSRIHAGLGTKIHTFIQS